jgi:hypothetical protein
MQLPDVTKWHFIGMNLLACKVDAGGWLNYSNEDIAYLLRTEIEQLELSLSLLLKSKFIVLTDDVYSISDYSENQDYTQIGTSADAKREATRKRVEKHRSKIKEKKNKDKEEEIEKKTEKEEDKEIDIDIEGNALHVTPVTHYTNSDDNSSSLATIQSTKEKIKKIISLGKYRDLDDFLIFNKDINLNLHVLDIVDEKIFDRLSEAVEQFCIDNPEIEAVEVYDIPF